MNGSAAILNITGLNKTYDPNKGPVLRDIELQVFEEDFLCILGPSGCGKTTLIRCVAGFEEYEGSICLDGKPVIQPGPDRTMVFQDFNQLFPWRTVLGNITYPLKVAGMRGKRQRQEKALTYLDKVRLSEYRDFYPHELSGGMKQRAAIARGMALGTRIMLMDEPFAALDAITRNRMQWELTSIKESEKMTILFITHNIQEAISMGSRIVVMSRDGRIREQLSDPLPKPVTPATPGYGELWAHLNNLLTDKEEQL